MSVSTYCSDCLQRLRRHVETRPLELHDGDRYGAALLEIEAMLHDCCLPPREADTAWLDLLAIWQARHMEAVTQHG